MIILTVATVYGVYRYSKWVRRDRPHPGGGPSTDPNDLPPHNDGGQHK
jgi:hypothetical protein